MASINRSKKETTKFAMQTESDFESCAARLKALADPDRLQIVNCLLQGNKCVTDLTEELRMPMDKVSHHLGVLRAANLVQTQKQGKFVIYSLAAEVAAAGAIATGAKNVDLGCCQLDLVQLVTPQKESRAPARRKSS